MSLRRLLPLAIVVLALGAWPARADTVDPEARSTARKLGQEGLQLFDAGNFKGALEKLSTANQLVPTPTLGLYAARCLVRLGRLVEASERYLDVSRMQLERGAPPVMRKAIADAVEEREKLLRRIPTLEVTIDGPEGEGITIVVDGRPFLPGLLGEKRPVDPGRHAGMVKRRDAVITQAVDVSEGAAAQLVLRLPPLPPPPPPPPETQSPLRLAGWIGVGVGGAGVIIGAISGGISVSDAQTLSSSKNCSNFMCSGAEAGTISTYHTVTKLTTAGLVVGGVGLAFGIPVLLLTPKREAKAEPAVAQGFWRDFSLEPAFGPSEMGVRGGF
jgi:hypothetical protein